MSTPFSLTDHLTPHCLTLSKASGIEVGDVVKVLRRFKDGELGCGTDWLTSMTATMGGYYTVVSLDEEDGSVMLDVGETGSAPQLWYAWFVLQVVSKGAGNTKTPPNFYTLSPQAHDSLRALHAASHFTKGDRVRILCVDPLACRFGVGTGRDALVGTIQTVDYVDGNSVRVGRDPHWFSFWGVEKVGEDCAVGACAVAPTSPAAPQGVATPAPSSDLPNFIVDLGQDSPSRPHLSRLIQELAFTGGVRWAAGDADVRHAESRYLRVRRRPDSIRLGLTHTSHLDSFKTDGEEADRTILSAVSDLPRLIALLSSPYVAPKPPAPVAPVLYGYSGQYSRGCPSVVFGCAQIDLALLREAQALLSKVITRGNRTVTSLTLNSGRILDAAQIASVLAYVAAVDEAGA